MKKIILVSICLTFISFTNAQKNSSDNLSDFDNFNPFGFKIGGGIFIPNGNLKKYIGTSPLIEINFGFPFNFKKSVDIVLQFAIPNQKKEFQFIRNIDTVSTKSNFMFNAFLRFKKKVIEKEKSNISVFFGIGISTITTDARNPFYSGQEGENKYEFISAILIAPGFDYTHQFKNKGEISFGINYHYSPYKTEGALRDDIGSSGIVPRIVVSF